jgi:hypothetical protein
MGIPERVPDNPQYLFRAVSEEDYQGIFSRGFMKSDGRMNLTQAEGTVASSTNPSWYLPGGLRSNPAGQYPGRILKIKLDPADGWSMASDGYWKTSSDVPASRIEMVSPQIVRDVSIGPRVRTWDQFRRDMGIVADSAEDASFRAAYAADIEVRGGVDYITQGRDNPIRFEDFRIVQPDNVTAAMRAQEDIAAQARIGASAEDARGQVLFNAERDAAVGAELGLPLPQFHGQLADKP